MRNPIRQSAFPCLTGQRPRLFSGLDPDTGAQVANTPEWGADLMDNHFDPVVLRLIGLLRKALPGCSDADIFWGYHFVTGALMLTLARTGRIDALSGGLCHSDDFEAVKARMATFMAAGFREICKHGE